MDVETSLSVSDHWRERRCLYSFRQRQIGQSDYDITAYCGKNSPPPGGIGAFKNTCNIRNSFGERAVRHKLGMYED